MTAPGTRDTTDGARDDVWAHYNGLLLGPDVERLRKLLVRYELFKSSLEVPGDIVECGVFKGAGLMYWLKLLHIYAPGSQKRVIGFDTFGRFAGSLLEYERSNVDAFVQQAAFSGADPDRLLQQARAAGLGDRVELVAGDVAETGPAYVRANPGFRIALLNLDLDTYQGTRAALEAFFPLVVRGGVVILDEYGRRGWGESDAVDDFLRDKAVRLRSVPFASQPTTYLVK